MIDRATERGSENIKLNSSNINSNVKETSIAKNGCVKKSFAGSSHPALIVP